MGKRIDLGKQDGYTEQKKGRRKDERERRKEKEEGRKEEGKKKSGGGHGFCSLDILLKGQRFPFYRGNVVSGTKMLNLNYSLSL